MKKCLKKVIRLITFKPCTEHSEPVFKDLRILNIEQINHYLTSALMFRYHHLENLPEIFNNYFITNKDIHEYNSRGASQLHKTFMRTNYAKHTRQHRGVNV